MDKLITGFFYLFYYIWYKKKYNLPKDFRFNGYFIRIKGNGKIIAGKNCYISFFSYINLGENSTLKLGNNVSIGHNIKIYTSSFNSEEKILLNKNKSYSSDIEIGNNVLIGANCFIMPGVKIEDNVIIGANSVIMGTVTSNSVYSGNPGILIKKFENIKR